MLVSHVNTELKQFQNLHWKQYIYIYAFMHLADAFIQSDLQYIQVITFFVSMCTINRQLV